MILTFIFFSLLLFITTTPNAIHALLALIVLFINFAILLFLTDTPFLGFAYILVYIGAICVLFLYIILLLHMRTYSLMQKYNTITLIGLMLIFLFMLPIFFSGDIIDDLPSFHFTLQDDLQLFTSYLFITHQHYMFLGVILLLLALFLSIFLSTRFLGKPLQRNNDN